MPTTDSRTGLSAPEGQRVTFVELFFDLVFVFGLTQVTHIVEHDLTWVGRFQGGLVFWLIFLAWTQWTWALNRTDTEHAFVRATILAATGVAFIMTTAVHESFGGGAFWFVVPYVIVRLMGLGLFLRVSREGVVQRAAVRTFALLSIAGLATVLGGAAVDTPLRYWLWGATIGLDFIAGTVASREHGWNLNVTHFLERHALFVIIALGETLIDAGIVAVSQHRSPELMIVSVGTVIVTCLLWWTYFSWFRDGMERRLDTLDADVIPRIVTDAYSFLHFPLIGGVIGVAIGCEKMIAYPHESLPPGELTAYALGLILFVGSTAAAWFRVTGVVLVARLFILTVTIGALAIINVMQPEFVLVVTVVGLAAIVVHEQLSSPQLSE